MPDVLQCLCFFSEILHLFRYEPVSDGLATSRVGLPTILEIFREVEFRCFILADAEDLTAGNEIKSCLEDVLRT